LRIRPDGKLVPHRLAFGAALAGVAPQPQLVEERIMLRRAVASVAVVLFVATSVLAQEHPQMESAKKDLESAKSQLQAAADDYGGHRKQAIELIDKALGQINQGLAVVTKKEQKVEHKEQKLEGKGQKASSEAEKLKAREQQMQQH
jgi:hypothetical protein